MIKAQTNSSQNRYLITPSLLNAWGYIWECASSVKEAESDSMCLEDKIALRQQEAYESFINTLNRIPSETNEYMQRGIEYEDECYKGNTECSPIIENGAFQIVGMKHKTIKGINFLLYGRLDVLKGGIIYDIKRVSRYSIQKYLHSYQHAFYLELFSRAYQFTYLVYDGKNLHQETYYRDNSVNIDSVIEQFITWLDNNNLLGVYLDKWKSRE